MDSLFVGVDVGSGSARAALVDQNGKILKTASRNIKIWSPKTDFFQQSSEDIWKACCFSVQEVIKNIDPKLIKGIGFDATCSLAVFDKNGLPVSISPCGEDEQNVIMWMDHRAAKEADFINSTRNRVLDYVGGRISLEMEIPKLLWIKKNDRKCWETTDLFFDLPDFLTWKATGSESRSLCSVVCKWTYEAAPNEKLGWNKDFFKEIGLEDLLENNCRKIGNRIQVPGEPCGNGLTKKAADELGLIPGTPVGTSIIDAHAGGLGLVGSKVDNSPINITSRLSLICGTSTCHMALDKLPMFVRGVWGPYFSAMVPGLWLNEAGQSATGKLIDHIVDNHPATNSIRNKLKNERVVDYLNNLIAEKSKKENVNFDVLTRNIHVWPDFHGNRSPIADSTLKGMISGLDLANDEENLALLYLATLQSLCYGTRHIMEVLQEKGYVFDTILACGGLSKNELFLKTQANAAAKSVLIPQETESVLVGAAILGARASGVYETVESAVVNMGSVANRICPNLDVSRYHDKKYKVFKKMLDHQLLYRNIMLEE